jgi:hypothetical protein
MRLRLALILTAALITAAAAERIRTYGASGSGPAPPPVGCTSTGGTDWSNACNLPLLAAIGF